MALHNVSSIVLCCHQVKELSDSLTDKRIGVIEPRKFKKVVFYERLMGYKFISLDCLTENLSQSKLKKLAVITFDDGF